MTLKELTLIPNRDPKEWTVTLRELYWRTQVRGACARVLLSVSWVRLLCCLVSESCVSAHTSTQRARVDERVLLSYIYRYTVLSQ